ncbi:EamA family transporter [Aeromicrobium sp. JJY06]|uniref:DMT family transporter n=1 Tax=Aeromicrobium sp. JJY06 TaxID=3373478 RepID=UPI00376EFB72
MLAVILALCSAACGGAADFVGGTASKRLSAFLVVLGNQFIGLVLIVGFIIAIGAWPGEWDFLWWAVGAGVTALVGLVAFYQALATGKMSVVAPIAALGAVVPVAWGLLTGDEPAMFQVVGILIALVGIVLASGPELEGGTGMRPLMLAVLAAVGFGSHMALLGEAAEVSALGTIMVMKASMVIPLLVLVTLVGRIATGLVLNRSTVALFVGLALLDLGANAFFTAAIQQGMLSIVAVLGSLYPVFTVLLARAIHGERLVGPQPFGVGAALAGVALIAAAG